MNDVYVILLSILAGYSMATLSALIGAWLSCKLLAGKDGLPFMSSPKGEAFTIEDIENDEPFPVEDDSSAQEHILERTNKFLQTLGGSK